MISGTAKTCKTLRSTKYQTVLYVFVLLSYLTLSACGGGGGGTDPIPDDSNNNINNAITNSGTIFAGSTPVTVNAGTSDFTVTGLSASTTYTVWVHDLASDVSLSTYIDQSFLVRSCLSDNAGTNTEDCTTISTTDGKIYLKISSATNTSYIITVRTTPHNEGTLASPVALTAGTPYNGQVGVGNSYYALSGLTPGVVYNISLDGILVDADLTVSMLKTFEATCQSSNSGDLTESCLVPANFQGKIYIKTDSNDFGAYYTINATATGNSEYIFEGYRDEPVDLTGLLPYSAQVNRHDSYYMFTGLTPGIRYEVRINNTTVDTPVYLFDTSDFVNVDCSLNYSGRTPLPGSRLCVATAPASGSLYLQIPYYLTAGGTYEVDLGLAPVAEGTSSLPREIQLASMPYDGQVDTSYSYYVLTGLIPNYVYDVEFNNPTHHYARYSVADDLASVLSSLGCGSPCAVRSNSNGEIYVRVNGTSTDNENNDLGAWFTLAFGNAENSEGTTSAPVSIPTDGSIYQGQVTEIASYYKASGLNPNQYYLIYHTTDVYSGPGIYAYANDTYSSNICSNSPFRACLAPANANGELFLRASYNSVYGARFNLWINPSLITSEGSISTPVNITGSLVTSGIPTVHSGQVTSYMTNNNSYYMVSGLPGTTNYTISLSGLTDDVYVEVFSDASLSNILCASNHVGIQDEICVAQTTATGGPIKDVELYIRVTLDKIRTPGDAIWDGANFTLTVSPGGNNIVSQGASGAPVDITSSLPYAGMVRKSGDSYYRITGLDPATSYAVMLNYDDESLGLRILGDINYTLTNWLCVSNNSDDFSEHCTTTPNASGEMYILVEGNNYSDSRFTIDLIAAPVFEGAELSPMDISSILPYSGQAGFYQSNDNSTMSYYKVSGLLTNTGYLVTTKNTTQHAYTSVNGSSYCFNNGWAPAESCRVTSDGNGEIFITIRASEGSFFDLDVQLAPESEGTVNSPIIISPNTPYQGSNGNIAGIGSYYKVTGLAPFSSHRISLTEQDDDQWVKVFTDGTYQYELCYSSYDNHDVGCGATANAAGEIYFTTGYSASYYELYVP